MKRPAPYSGKNAISIFRILIAPIRFLITKLHSGALDSMEEETREDCEKMIKEGTESVFWVTLYYWGHTTYFFSDVYRQLKIQQYNEIAKKEEKEADSTEMEP